MHYRYRDSVVLIPRIESWDFKGPKVLPEHATLTIPDNVDYSLRFRLFQKLIDSDPVILESRRKLKELLQAERQAPQVGEPLLSHPSQEPHEPDT